MADELPERMRALPLFKGLPIPFFTLIRDGVPDFRAHEASRHAASMLRRLCGICGSPLDYWITFIVGPITHESRLTYMPGMHEDCARTALEICPFLAREERTYSAAPLGPGNVAIAQPPPKPDRQALVKVRSYEVVHRSPEQGMEYAQFAPPRFTAWYRYRDGRLVRESP